jgi:hypothetical protein
MYYNKFQVIEVLFGGAPLGHLSSSRLGTWAARG